MRRLEAAGKGQSGWLDAETTFSPGSGLRFSVLAEGGSSYIRSRVLRFLLEQEQQLIARGGVDAVAISPANYTFLPDGTTEEGLARVTIEPRRKEGALIVGHMFIRPGDGELIRVEGRLAKNPSFWVTRAEVVRTYRRLNGAIVPTALETVAQLRMFGSSHLRMSYRYVEIDNRPVEE